MVSLTPSLVACSSFARSQEKIRQEEEKERLAQENMSMKERRLRRRAAKEKKGGAQLDENQRVKEEVPHYIHFMGNCPMGCLQDYEIAEQTFLFRAFVIDPDMVSPHDWGRLHRHISWRLGYSGDDEKGVGWFSRREILEDKMIAEDDMYIKYLLCDPPLDLID